jgi:hypothetical protein
VSQLFNTCVSLVTGIFKSLRHETVLWESYLHTLEGSQGHNAQKGEAALGFVNNGLRSITRLMVSGSGRALESSGYGMVGGPAAVAASHMLPPLGKVSSSL